MNMLNEVMVMNEAAHEFGITEGTIRAAIKNGRLVENVDYRKGGRVTLVLRSSIEREWGKFSIKREEA